MRTGDLDNVGRTPRHHTFFEMLGNFSFGDYFKREAINWAWEFITDVMAFPKDKLWISVYEDDEESYNIWKDEVKIPADKIVKLGAHSNFWPADAPTKGPNGPCGPCSEIFYDWGEDKGCGEENDPEACDIWKIEVVIPGIAMQRHSRPDLGFVYSPRNLGIFEIDRQGPEQADQPTDDNRS